MMNDQLLEPMIQYGFAGFSAVLIGIIVWLIRRLLDVLEKTNTIIAANTAAIRDVSKMTNDELKLLRTVHERLLQRPCMAEK